MLFGEANLHPSQLTLNTPPLVSLYALAKCLGFKVTPNPTPPLKLNSNKNKGFGKVYLKTILTPKEPPC